MNVDFFDVRLAPRTCFPLSAEPVEVCLGDPLTREASRRCLYTYPGGPLTCARDVALYPGVWRFSGV
jgi:hypothetical protein